MRKTKAAAYLQLLYRGVLGYELVRNRVSSTLAVAVERSIVERIGSLYVIIVFEPTLYLTILVAFGVVRIGLGILGEAYHRVLAINIADRELVAKLELIETVSKIDVSTYVVTLGFFHNTGNTVIS